jgi:hypothetical protein
MFVPYYGTKRVFIANYSSWREYAREGRIAEVASSLLSHESLHTAINQFSPRISAHLDNMFGRSDSWELYHHGLGDLRSSTASYLDGHYLGKSAKKRKKKKTT